MQLTLFNACNGAAPSRHMWGCQPHDKVVGCHCQAGGVLDATTDSLGGGAGDNCVDAHMLSGSRTGVQPVVVCSAKQWITQLCGGYRLTADSSAAMALKALRNGGKGFLRLSTVWSLTTRGPCTTLSLLEGARLRWCPGTTHAAPSAALQ